MYPEILPEVREAIKRRYELIPYLYSLMLEAHMSAMPVLRWVGMGHEDDPEVWRSKVLKDGEEQFWLEHSLTIGGVFEPGVKEAKVYLPKGNRFNPYSGKRIEEGYLNTNAPYQHLKNGQWHAIASPWKTSIPVLARVGGIVPVGRPYQTRAPGDIANEAQLPEDDYRAVEIFPSPGTPKDGTESVNSWYEDDGISSVAIADKQRAKFTVTYQWIDEKNISKIFVEAEHKLNGFEPPWLKNGLVFILPVGDEREVINSGPGRKLEPIGKDDRGRACWLMAELGLRFEDNWKFMPNAFP